MKIKSIFSDSGRLILWRLFALLISLITSIFLARTLGPEDRGVLMLIMLTITLLTVFFQLGIPEASIYFWGQKNLKKEILIRQLFTIVLILGFSGAVINIILHTYIYPQGINMYVISFCIFQGIVSALFRHIIISIGTYNIYGLLNLLEFFLYLIGLLIVYHYSFLNINNIIMIYAVSLIVPFFINMLIVYRVYGLTIFILDFDYSFLKRVISKGIHLLFIGIGGFLTLRLNYFFIDSIMGARSTGLFTVANTIPSAALNIPQQVATVIYAHTAKNHGPTTDRSMIPFIVRWMLLISIIVVSIFASVSRMITLLIFGEEYIEISSLVPVLLLAAGVGGTANIVFNALAGSGRHYIGTYTTLIGLGSVGVSGLIFIPQYDFYGACVGILIGNTLNLLLCIQHYCKLKQVDFREFIWKIEK